MDAEQEELAREMKDEQQKEKSIKGVQNALNVAKATKVGAVLNAADKVTGQRLSRAAGTVVHHVPVVNKVSEIAGSKVASAAASAASPASKLNPLKKEDGPSTVGKASGYMPLDNESPDENGGLFSSVFLGLFSGKNIIIGGIIGSVAILFIGIIFLAMVSSAIGDVEDMNKAQGISDISSFSVFQPSAAVASPMLINPTIIANISDLITKKIDFKLFNKNKPNVDGDGVSNEHDNSSFGDFLSTISNKFPEKFVPYFFNIGSVFSYGAITCKDETCGNNSEMLFYQKITDISYRYKKLYNIELDWPLITSTVLINSDDKYKTFADNLNTYTTKEVNNLKKTMSLDWDYVYDEIDDYEYLAGLDSRYDLQILAKNMVKKTTTQKCTLGDKVISENELIDVEDSKLEKEEELYKANLAKGVKTELEYYVPCTGGAIYSSNSVYTLDKEKYDEFLNEYLENKYYIKYNVRSSSSGGVPGGGPGSSSGDYGWPLPEGYKRINSDFGWRNLNGGRSYHGGIDFYAPEGTPVYAIADGVVTSAVSGCVVGNMTCGGSGGNHIYIDHGNGIKSAYMHASQILVSNGQQVKRGDLIMYAGNTGHSFGAHLHLGIKDSSGNWVDPGPYLGIR